MTSVKCRSCGLVNFSTEQSCKRCKSALYSVTSASARFEAFQMPPPPPIFHGDGSSGANSSVAPQSPPCIKCGGRQKIAIRSFVKIYNSPVAILGIFLGLLPYVILKLLLRTKHDLTGPFCERCWTRFQNSKIYSVGNVLLFFVLLFGGVALSIYIDSVNSEWLLLGSVIMAFVVLTAGHYYLATLGPKYKRVNAKEVVIDAPFVGEIVYTK